VSAPDAEVAVLSASDLATRYRSRSLAPTEVVDALLARIARLDGTINAWITIAAEPARAAARASTDRHLRGRPLGPLDGVPVGLKDNCDTAGVRTTCGSRILGDRVPDRDAVVARRLRDAGAVLLGKTNMLEFAYGNVHPDRGQCNNPWDPSRTAGGSSSGSAAAVAAGMVPLAVGTDTGGSVRIPAAYCGIVGLKPTFGRVSHQGVFPLSWSIDHVGPIGRTVDDVATLLDVMATEGGGGGPRVPAAAAAGTLAGVRAGVLRQHLGDDLRSGVRAAFERALAVFRDAGAVLEDVQLPTWEHAEAAHILVLAPEASQVHAGWLRTRPQDYAPDTLLQLQLGALLPASAYLSAQRFRNRMAAEAAAALGRVDVLLSPTVGFVAPASDPPLGSELGQLEGLRTGAHCLLGLPAVSVPCGTAEDGLPAALQVAGGWGRDHQVLGVAAAFLRGCGWVARLPPELR